MKKKRVLFGCLIATMSLVISACDFLPQDFLNGFGKNSSEQTTSSRILPSRPSSSSQHEHTYSEDWSYNYSAHWHDATCGHNVKSDIEAHTFDSITVKEPTCTSSGERVEICLVCDYQRSTALPPTDHNWHEYSRVEPTCDNPGSHKCYCTMCGTTKEEELPPLGHDYETISYLAPTCSTPGHILQRCMRCGETYEYDVPTTAHSWRGYETYHSACEGGVSYYTDTCKICGATKIKILARGEGSVFNGNLKSGTANDYGYMKFNTNGGNVSYTFDYSSTAFGTLYQHGVFDQNPGQFSGYNYRTGNNSGGYNFEMTVNGQVVDLAESSNISYGEFFDNGEEIGGLTNNGYSYAAECLVGNISLNQGINTMTYTRIASYNIWVDYFVLIVQNSEHQHMLSAGWSADGESHWRSCMDPNCPIAGSRINSEPHSFGGRYVAYPATCQSEGLEYEICTVCGYQCNYYIPATDHDYQNIGAFEKVNNSTYSEEYTCSTCNQNALRWNALDYDVDSSVGVEQYSGTAVRFMSGMVENQNGIEQQGAHIIYKINVPQALNNVGLAFYMSQSRGYPAFRNNVGSEGYIYDQYGNLVPSDKKYGLRVNGQEIYLGEDAYDSVADSATHWYNWPVSFNLVEGENTIDIYCLSSGYRGRMYQFQITGVPYMEPNHIHTAADHYEYDANYHYYPCVNNDGVRFNEEWHTFDNYVTTVEPTCTNYGEQRATCSVCGYVQTYSIAPNGHTWNDGEVITQATHTDAGQIRYTCLVCGEQKIENVPAGHNWGEATYVEPTIGSQVGYTTRQCSDDDAIQIDINAMNGMFTSGYSYAGGNYIRLSSVGSAVYYTFNFNQHAVGKLYLRGSINSYSSYSTRPVLNSGTTGSNGYNFEVSVNNNLVDMSELNGLTFADVFNKGNVDSSLPTAYSPVADLPIGTVELNPGENTIMYQRNGSYNIYMSDIILVVSPSDHVHSTSNGYACDDNYHWYYCTDPSCPTPNTVFDKEPHDFVPADGEQQIGCYSENSVLYVCTKCGYQKGFTGYVDHAYSGDTLYANNSDGYEVRINTCSTCGRTVESMYFDQGIVTNGSYNGKLQAGTTMTWKMPVSKTGQISIYLPCRMSVGNTGQTFDPSLYNLTINGVSTQILLPYGTYDELGINSNYTKYYKWATYQVTQNDVRNGEIEISFTSNVSSYRMSFEGEIRIEY